MGGFFGTVAIEKCAADLFYGTDYQSHLGTRRGGMASYSKERGFYRAIHNLESTYFRTRFESELSKFEGEAGIGIISDTDAQPMLFNSHLGRFAIVTVAKVNNLEEIADQLLQENMGHVPSDWPADALAGHSEPSLLDYLQDSSHSHLGILLSSYLFPFSSPAPLAGGRARTCQLVLADCSCRHCNSNVLSASLRLVPMPFHAGIPFPVELVSWDCGAPTLDGLCLAGSSSDPFARSLAYKS